MSDTNKNSSGLADVFVEITKAIEVVGQKRFLNLMKDLQGDNVLKHQNDITKAVIEMVCSEFGLTSRDVLYGRENDGVRIHAIGIITYILYHEFGFDYNTISLYLNKGFSILSRRCSMVKAYDSNHILDKKKIAILESVKHQVKLYKKKNDTRPNN